MSENSAVIPDTREHAGFKTFIERFTPLAIALGIAFMVLHRIYYWTLHPLLVSSDQSVYLAMAELILQGKVPYRDFFDFNPPLIMYLNTIPVTVAHLMHWPDPLGLSLTIEFVHIAATAYIGWLIWRHRTYLPVVPFIAVLLMFAYFTTCIDQDMGQREHIFTLLFFPFFILRGLRHFGAPIKLPESLISSLLCGTILCLKPHFFFVFICSEAGFLLESKNFKALLAPEIFALALPPVVYGVAFMCLPHEARFLFFDQILPVYIWGNGWASKCFTHMLVGYSYFYDPFYQVTFALILAFFFRPASRWFPAFIFITVAALLNYIQGAQAWTYRLLPMALFAKLLIAFEFGVVFNYLYVRLEKIWIGFRPIAALLFMVAIGYSCALRLQAYLDEYNGQSRYNLANIGFVGENPRSDFDSTFFSMVENSRPGDYVVHIGSGIRPGYPCQLQACRKPASRYLYFMITMILTAIEKKPELKSKWLSIEKTVIENLGEDILKNKPVVVYLQDWPVDEALEEYNFKKRFLRNYSLAGHVDATQIYRLTGRKVNLSDFTPQKRADVVLPILLKIKTIKQVADEQRIPQELVKDWTDRAHEGILLRLKDRSTDREDELKAEINRLGDELWAKGKEADKLRQELEKTHKKLE